MNRSYVRMHFCQPSQSFRSDSPPNHPSPSRYGGGLQYANHGYDPTTARLIEAPANGLSSFTSPTIDNLTAHNRQQHFISTTNLNILDKPTRRIQSPLNETKASLAQSTPYLSRTRDADGPSLKPSVQSQIDQHSAVGSDSGIVMVSSNHQAGPEENQLVERKLTSLVQQLGKQLETDAQKINEKLEMKLKSLEEMIHQQTYIIRRQDEVIERMKSKIFKIEGERDHLRTRLTHHEEEQKHAAMLKQPERSSSDEHSNKTDRSVVDPPTVRKHSNASSSTPESNKPSTKKVESSFSFPTNRQG